jgi:S1-C subfamily serine protease
MPITKCKLTCGITVLATTLCFLIVPAVFGQDAVPREILDRTLLIKARNEAGTAFKIDYQGKVYLVTARHVIAGLPAIKATIQVLRSDRWEGVQTVKTLFPLSADADIAVLETDEKVSQPFQITPAGKTEGPTFGQQIWFLGYPWGIRSRFSNGELPFIKRGTMSAIDATDPNAILLYIDGFNNPGFSGGPILYWDFSSHAYRILGVVKGYRNDTAKVLINGEQVDTNILVNSGILVGYSINHAIQAVEEGQKQP